MGWLSRLFPGAKQNKADNAPAQSRTASSTSSASGRTTTQAAPASTNASIPPEKMGLNGEFDESGLAKRVALAFDQDSQIDDIETIWVAQLGSRVVLKGKAPNQSLLTQMVSVARGVRGATDVDTSQVTVG